MSRSRLLRPGWLLLVLPAAFACFDPDRVPTGTTPSTETDPFACEDGRDNDGDGLVDCQDPDCIQRNFCGEIPSQGCFILRNCRDSMFGAPINAVLFFQNGRWARVLVDLAGPLGP